MEILGKKCVIRADRAGVFCGVVSEVNDTPAGREVVMKDVRRLWYWNGAASISQLATEGVKRPEDCKFTVSVTEMSVMQVIEIIPCTEEAVASIEAVRVWRIG